MQQQSSGDNTQGLKVLLEIVPEDQQSIDPVAIGEIGRTVVEELRQEGYKVTPEYTGKRGAELLFQIANFVMAQSAGISVVASLVSIIAPFLPFLEKIFHASEKQGHPVKISLFINGHPVSIEAENLKEAEAALKLAERYHASYPSVNPHSNTSQVKVQITAPKQTRHKHRH